MNTSSIFTKKRLGLDSNVWLVFLLTIVIGSVIVGFRMATPEKPIAFDIAFKGTLNNKDSFRCFEYINFSATAPVGTAITWDFGDKTPQKKGNFIKHSYTREGTYTVTAEVNGKWVQKKNIIVYKVTLVQQTQINKEQIKIIGNTNPRAGEITIFSTNVAAIDYEWSILNDPNFEIKKGLEAGFTFPLAKKYILQLKLDNDREKIITQQINVSQIKVPVSGGDRPKPPLPPPTTNEETTKDGGTTEKSTIIPPVVTPPPPPEKKKPTITSEQAFKNYLQAYVCGRMDYTKLYKYFCEDNKPKVLRDKKFIGFEAFCNEIGGKKIEITSVNFKKEDDCIVIITVEYDKKNMIQKDPCKE